MGLSELFRDLFGLSDEPLIQRLTELGEVRHVKKGHLLYREGEVSSKLTFLIKGLLRGFILDAGGRVITDCFIYEPGSAAVGCTKGACSRFSTGASAALAGSVSSAWAAPGQLSQRNRCDTVRAL